MTGGAVAVGVRLARAAAALVGAPFRLYGRDPATGLDCVGVLAVVAAANGCARAVPGDYALRMRDVSRFTDRARAFGFAACDAAVVAGDVLLFHVGPDQQHFAIAAEAGGFVHAHAGLRRVVVSEALPDWGVAGHWRSIHVNGND